MAICVRTGEGRQLIIVTFEGVIDDMELIHLDAVLRDNGLFQSGCPLLFDFTPLKPGDMKLTGWGIYRYRELTEKDINMVAIVAIDEVAYGMARMYEAIANWCFDRV